MVANTSKKNGSIFFWTRPFCAKLFMCCDSLNTLLSKLLPHKASVIINLVCITERTMIC